MNYFRRKNGSKGHRSTNDESGSASLCNTPQATFQGTLSSRRRQLLSETSLPDVVPPPHRPHISRQLFHEDGSPVASSAGSAGSTLPGVRMPPIHRSEPSPATAQARSTPTAEAPSTSAAGAPGGSSSSEVAMPPPHLFMPPLVPALPAVDERGVPIPEELTYIHPQQAYVYEPFDTPLSSARVSDVSTSESGKY